MRGSLSEPRFLTEEEQIQDNMLELNTSFMKLLYIYR